MFEYETSNDAPTIFTPQQPYGSAKAALYLSLNSYFEKTNIQFCWCRLFYLYGEGEDKRKLSGYVRTQLENNRPAILTNSNQVCDFIDVEIAAEQIAYVTANSLNGVFNICSGVPMSVRQFAEKIAQECGRSNL